jgi:hypothetical protein
MDAAVRPLGLRGQADLRRARLSRQAFCEMNRLPVSEPGIAKSGLAGEAAHFGVRARGLGGDHLMAEIDRARLHRRHHLKANTVALEGIGDRDGKFAMPCRRVVGVSRFADDPALPSEFGEQGEMIETVALGDAFGRDRGRTPAAWTLLPIMRLKTNGSFSCAARHTRESAGTSSGMIA